MSKDLMTSNNGSVETRTDNPEEVKGTTNGTAVAERVEEHVVTVSPAADLWELEDGTLRLDVELPGVAADKIELTVEKRVLTVEGRREHRSDDRVVTRRLRRQFRLSEDYAGEKIDASLDKGVLSLSIPRREELKARRIEIRTV